MRIAVNGDSCHVGLCGIKSPRDMTQYKQHEWRKCDTADRKGHIISKHLSVRSLLSIHITATWPKFFCDCDGQMPRTSLPRRSQKFRFFGRVASPDSRHFFNVFFTPSLSLVPGWYWINYSISTLQILRQYGRGEDTESYLLVFNY